MRRLLKWVARVFALSVTLLVLAIVTRRYWLPERFAVNLPGLQALLGRDPAAPSVASLKRLTLPKGFALSRFAAGLKNARFLRITESGDVIVSQPREGRVTLLRRDENGDGASDGTEPLLDGLDRPHGLALKDGFLYVAEMTAVGRIHFDAASRKTSGAFERVITGLPSGGNHWTRTIGFGPDGFLYVSVGSSCNVCLEEDERRAAISRYDPASFKGAVYARGLRNAVGFAWRPGTLELFATDNGRDLLGDDFPPCELNRVVENGFYGWPFANGDRVKDPDFGDGHEKEIATTIPPAHGFRAHNAPLGIAFLEGSALSPDYQGSALVALHGSWNRTTKDGYKVVSIHWDGNGRITEKDFLTGFVENDTVIGRPVDIAQARDGSIYVSDDYAGSIFRITTGAAAAAAAPNPTPTNSGSEIASAPLTLDHAAVARGRDLWRLDQCDLCHDPAVVAKDPENKLGKTTKLLVRLQGKYDVAKMVKYLEAPQPPMPLFEMTAAERRDLAAYVLDRFR